MAESWWWDARYALRALRRTPTFALIAIATLELRIGANMAILAVVDAVILRPLPYAEPDRLVMVWEDASALGYLRNTPAPANYLSWLAMTRSFSGMAATRNALANLTSAGLSIGLALAFAATRILQTLLFGVTATGPLTFIAAVAVLGMVSIRAAGIPALRAARLDPAAVLNDS